MNKLIKVAILVLIAFNLNAQTIHRRQIIKTIVQQRNIYLNGGARVL